jgi:predicted membrane protein
MGILFYFIGLGSLVKARNLWGKKKKKKKKNKKKKKWRGKRKKRKKGKKCWVGQARSLSRKTKKNDFVDLLSVLLGRGQADLPHVSVRIMNWFSLTLVNL